MRGQESTTVTAAEYVALAKHAAVRCFDLGLRGGYLGLYENGGYSVNPAFEPERVVMRCDLTPENVASESALVRALLASAVVQLPGEPVESPFRYVLRGDQSAHARTRDALLDALLAERHGLLDHGDRP